MSRIALILVTLAIVCSVGFAQQCQTNINQMFNVLDATGKSPEDLGNHRECKLVGDVAKYCVMYEDTLRNGTIPPVGPGAVPIALGVCVPTSCNVTEIGAYVTENLQIYGLNNSIMFVTECMDLDHPLPWRSIVVLSLVVFLVMMVLVGSLIDYNRSEEKTEMSVLPTLSSIQSPEGDENSSLLAKTRAPRGERIKKGIVNVFLQFSLPKNVKSFMHQSPGELNALNGLRVFAMWWIILGHVSEFYAEFISNGTYVNTYIMTSFWFQIIPAAYWNVDTFFFLSGFLVAFGSLKMLLDKGRLPIVLFYVHRLLRIWPTYLFILVVYIHLSIFVGEGFIWDQYSNYITTRCDDTWWANVLFINNFHPKNFGKQCLGWSWYLANDMQFYIISPFFLYLLYKSRKIGIAVILVFIAATVGVTAWLMIAFETGPANPVNKFPDIYMDIVYGKPYCRIAPFLIGVLTADIYVRRDKTQTLSTMVRYLFYFVSLICLFCPVFFTQLNPDWSMAEGILYSGLGRVGWGVGIALLMYTCFVCPDTILNKLFSANIWGPMARLTFAAYLLHPMFLFTYYLNRDHLLIFSTSDLIFWFFGAVLISYLLSFAVGMLVEKPCINLENLLFKGAKKQPAVKSQSAD